FSLGRILLINDLKDKVNISINAHHSKVVVIAGHHSCAANPVSREEHEAQIRNAVKEISSWKLPITVVGLWIDSGWKANLLVTAPPK
ncbi:MAG: carbonic anhydrase, partial [Chloroflexota bacterium]